MSRFGAVAFGLAVSLLATGAQAASWDFREIKDPISDARRGISSLDGDGGSVIVKCDSNGPTSIYVEILSNKYLGAVENAERGVMMRIDDGPVSNDTWYYDGRTAVILNNRQAVSTAARLASAKKIVFRLTDYEGAFVDMVLTSDGNNSAVRQAFQSCGQPDDVLKAQPAPAG